MMRPERPPAHPDEDTLLALVDDEGAAGADVHQHVADCDTCAKRVAELLGTRSLLRAAAGRNQRSPNELAQRALSQLRMRHTSIEDVNELFASLRALFVGLAELFIGPKPPSGSAGITHASPDEGSCRG